MQTTDRLMVVETDDDRYLGTLEVSDGMVTIRTGMVGRPAVLHADDIISVTPADGHPDVEVSA